jgi:hypothetical protein
MLNGETYLLEAVRDILRIKLEIPDTACNCEYNEEIPAIADDVYFAVINGGMNPGPVGSTAAGVADVVHSVQVLVLNRKLESRDNRRNLFLQRLYGLNAAIDKVFKAIHRQVEICTLSNAYMFEDEPTSAPFQNTLRYDRIDAKARMYNSEAYGGTQIGGKGTTNGVALGRSIYFTGIRRMETVTQVHSGITTA